MVAEPEQDLLEVLCADLRAMWTQAGGPSLRTLGEQLQLSKSQVGAILNGHVRRLPDWQVVTGLVDGIHKHAIDHDRVERLSLRAGIDEYWRPRYTMLEHAFSRPRDSTAQEPPRPNERQTPHQLPAPPRAFTGRTRELAQLDAIVATARERPGELVVTAVAGTAGVGKPNPELWRNFCVTL